jgi:hypothetical protein
MAGLTQPAAEQRTDGAGPCHKDVLFCLLIHAIYCLPGYILKITPGLDALISVPFDDIFIQGNAQSRLLGR